jgi:hypothetical protein
MLSWISGIFSKGTADVVTSVGKTIDSLITSDEERLILKNKLQEEMNDLQKKGIDAVSEYDKQITERHKNDMNSDSWLSKNTRPMVLIGLTIATVVLAYLTIFVDLNDKQLGALESWLPLLQTLLITVFSFFYGSRGIEKVQNLRNNKSNKN